MSSTGQETLSFLQLEMQLGCAQGGRKGELGVWGGGGRVREGCGAPSSTGTLKASSSLCRVAAARLLLQLLMKRRGGGRSAG